MLETNSLIALVWAINKCVHLDDKKLEEISLLLNLTSEELKSLILSASEEYQDVLDYENRYSY